MMAEPAELRTIRVYCPTHKIRFTAAKEEQIICAAGPHALAQRFPEEGFWEYCCDCQSFWPTDGVSAGRSTSECLVCERATARRYLCNECNLCSLESDVAAPRKAFSIDSNGRVQPTCPNCLNAPSQKALAHDCPDSGMSFVTAYDICPFCERSLKPAIVFPATVKEVLANRNGASQEVRFDAASNALLPAARGTFVLILSGHGLRLPIVVPRLPRLATKQEYFASWYEVFDCDNPAPGEITILSPAVVEADAEGWKLRELGRIEIKPDPVARRKNPPADPALTCPTCGVLALPEDAFCKSCGHSLKAWTPSARVEVIEQTDPRPVDLNEQFAPGPDWQETTAPVTKPGRSSSAGKVIGLLVLALVAFVIFLSVAIHYAGSDSRPRKLEEAIASRNLFGTSGAYELYYQLKNSGTSLSELAKYEQKLLPLLVDTPNQMIAQLSEPGGEDPPAVEWEEARKLTSWASELRSGDKQIAARAAYCAGRVAYLAENYTEAQQQWARAAELDSTWPLPLNGIGLIYSNQKDYSTARRYYFDAVRRDPKWAYPYNNIGTSYYLEENKKSIGIRNYAQAKDYYQKAVQLVPHWARPHSWLGDIAMKERDFNTAATEFNAVLDANATGTHNMDLAKIRKQLELAQAQQYVETP